MVRLLEALPVAEVVSSLPFEHPLSALPVAQRACRDGDAWEWDGVRFAFLHPAPAQYLAPAASSNSLSCVLKVTAGARSMLLTGDIEAAEEQALLLRHRGELGADVLTVPHQGSRTSSTPAFIAAVAPQDAIVAVGYRNRFGHPKAEIVARYGAQGVAIHRTDAEGALRVDLRPPAVAISAARAERRRYWHGR